MSKHTKHLRLLFSTFPPQPGDLAAMMEAYDIALEGHDESDIEAAVHKLIRGEVSGHNQSFAPSAAMLGSVVRERMTARLDAERRRKPLTLPKPDIEHTPESRARVKALVEEVTRRLAWSAGDPDGDDGDMGTRAA